MVAYITDYIENPTIEHEILGDKLSDTQNDNIEVLLVWHKEIDSKYLSSFPNLKGVVRYGVGYDNVDLDAIKSRGLIFCNTPDYGTDEVSDTAIAFILNIARGISRYDFQCRYYDDGSWQENTIPTIRRTSELNLGIIGAGRIGGSVCLKAKAIGFNVSFYDPYLDSGYEKMIGVHRNESMKNLLMSSDIVSLHVPLSKRTKSMVNSQFIKTMKSGSSLVNTARGELIESFDIIYDSLYSGTLSSVALDVLPKEPPPHTNNLINAWYNREEWLDGRLLINPHSAYYSIRAYREMRLKTAQNALRIINGEQPKNIIC